MTPQYRRIYKSAVMTQLQTETKHSIAQCLVITSPGMKTKIINMPVVMSLIR